jgi:hypothetical protein
VIDCAKFNSSKEVQHEDGYILLCNVITGHVVLMCVGTCQEASNGPCTIPGTGKMIILLA